MTAPRAGLAVALALVVQGCAAPPTWTRRHILPPPAQESRAGALARSTGPGSGSTATGDTNGTANTNASSNTTAIANATANTRQDDVTAAVKTIASLVGHRQIIVDGVDYGPGCAALARAAFARAGRPLPVEARDAAALHALAQSRGALLPTRSPSPGDLVFLADRPGGPPVHVGVVSRAEPDGTAVVLHRVARGVMPVRVNLAYPSRSDDPATGKHINDALRVGSSAIPAGSLVVSVSDLLRRR